MNGDKSISSADTSHASARTAKRKVLLVRLDAIGDYVLFRNVLRFIRQSVRYRDAEITVLGNPLWRNLAETFDRDCADRWIWLENRSLYFRKSIENLLPRKIWHSRVAAAQACLRTSLKEYGFDEVISPQSSRDPLLDELLTDLAPSVVGVRCDALDSSMYTRLLDPSSEPFVFLQARALVSQLAGEPCNESLTLKTDIESHGRDILVFTGASHWTKRWPRRRVRALVQLLLDQTDRRVILSNGIGDAPLRSFARSFRSTRVEALPAMPLADFAQRVASACAVVTNDTMALHLAAATDTPVVCIVNGMEGQGGFWPYPASLGKRVAIVGMKSSHKPMRFLPRLVASQLAKYRNLAAVQADEVLDHLLPFFAPPRGSHLTTPTASALHP